jgi:hypothetical protein
MLSRVSAARLTLRVSPACALSAAPTSCDSEVGTVATRISLNRGVLPHEMFMEQTRSFAAEVLPALDVHRVE